MTILPDSWPKHLPFSQKSYSDELPMDLLRLLMFASTDQKEASSLFDKKLVHADISIKKISHFLPNHPLANQKTMKGEEHHGIFAKKNINQGEILGEYVGRIYYFSSERELKENRTELSEYKWTVQHPHYILVIDSQFGANELALINDYRGIADCPNVSPSLIAHKGVRYFSYITTKSISVGEELLVDYGQVFWT